MPPWLPVWWGSPIVVVPFAALVWSFCAYAQYTEPVLSTSSQVFTESGSWGSLEVEAFHARNLTSITWVVAQPSSGDYISVYYDEMASDEWLAKWDQYLNQTVSSTSASSSTTNSYYEVPSSYAVDYTNSSLDWCAVSAYESGYVFGAFFHEGLLANASLNHLAVSSTTSTTTASSAQSAATSPSAPIASSSASASSTTSSSSTLSVPSATLYSSLSPSTYAYSTWFYTNTLGQHKAESLAAPASSSGSASVVLADVGVFQVCLFLESAGGCTPSDCVEVHVYQPPFDIWETTGGSILDEAVVRFNIASFNTQPTDWLYVAKGLQGTEDISDLQGSFSLGTTGASLCWVYLSTTGINYGVRRPKRALLCLPTSEDITDMQSTDHIRSYQYGTIRLNMGTSGMLAILYAPDDTYSYTSLSYSYLCGVVVAASVSPIMSTDQYVVTVSPELGGDYDCQLPLDGARFEVDLRTVAKESLVLGVAAEVSFIGSVTSITSTATTAALIVPIKSSYEANVAIPSGAVVYTADLQVSASEIYAPSCMVVGELPTSVNTNSTVSFDIVARDFYENVLDVGGAVFRGLTGTSPSTAKEGMVDVTDWNNGTYTVTATFMGSGTMFLDIYLGDDDGDHDLSGSPFEVYVVAPHECTSADIGQSITDCLNNNLREVTFFWNDGVQCTGGAALPVDVTVQCDEIPYHSSIGKTICVFAGIVSCYCLGWMVFIAYFNEHWVIRFSQSLFCNLFLGGCVCLNVANVLYLGPATGVMCVVRPWLMHFFLTFTFSVLLVKVHRAWKLFSEAKRLRRIKISNATLVQRVCALCAFDVLVLSVWTIVSIPTVHNFVEEEGYANVTHSVCDTDYLIFPRILWAYKLIVIAAGIFISERTWSLDDSIAESKPIALTIYNICVLELLNLLLKLFDPGVLVALIFQSVTVILGTALAATLIFYHKASMVKNTDANADASWGVMAVGGSSGSASLAANGGLPASAAGGRAQPVQKSEGSKQVIVARLKGVESDESRRHKALEMSECESKLSLSTGRVKWAADAAEGEVRPQMDTTPGPTPRSAFAEEEDARQKWVPVERAHDTGMVAPSPGDAPLVEGGGERARASSGSGGGGRLSRIIARAPMKVEPFSGADDDVDLADERVGKDVELGRAPLFVKG